MKYDEQQIFQQLREMRYPHQVDLVEDVMCRIEQQQSIKPTAWQRWGRFTTMAAASVAVVFGVAFGIYKVSEVSYSTPEIASMISFAYGYDQDDMQTLDLYSDMFYASLYEGDE